MTKIHFNNAFVCQKCLMTWVIPDYTQCPNCGSRIVADSFPGELSKSIFRYATCSDAIIFIGVQLEEHLKVTPVMCDPFQAMGLLLGLLQLFAHDDTFNQAKVWRFIQEDIHILQTKAAEQEAENNESVG